MRPLLNHNHTAAPLVIEEGGEVLVEKADYLFALDLALCHLGLLQVIGNNELAALKSLQSGKGTGRLSKFWAPRPVPSLHHPTRDITLTQNPKSEPRIS
jgi:hypothetical protein